MVGKKRIQKRVKLPGQAHTPPTRMDVVVTLSTGMMRNARATRLQFQRTSITCARHNSAGSEVPCFRNALLCRIYDPASASVALPSQANFPLRDARCMSPQAYAPHLVAQFMSDHKSSSMCSHSRSRHAREALYGSAPAACTCWPILHANGCPHTMAAWPQ